jgi:hypothetical protein
MIAVRGGNIFILDFLTVKAIEGFKVLKMIAGRFWKHLDCQLILFLSRNLRDGSEMQDFRFFSH